MKSFVKLPVPIAVVLLTGMIACNQREAPITYDIDIEKYEQTLTPDSVAEAYNKTLYKINQDLSRIHATSGRSAGGENPEEEGIHIQERISRNIMIINSLVDANKRQIAFLSSEVKKYKKGNTELYETLKESKKQLRVYENQMNALKEELQVKNFTEEELNMIIDDLILQSELLRLQSDKYRTELSTGYYVCQDKKALKKQGLLVQKGGILGIGQTTVLNADAASETNFTPIDIHKVRDIEIHGEKPELVTSHPEGTYEFQKKNNMVTYLHIENPEKFWKSSKYMVVAVR